MPIHHTFKFLPCSCPKRHHISPNHHWSTTILHGVMDMLRYNVFSISNPTLWPNHMTKFFFIFVSSLKVTSFQPSMVQFSYLWANLRHARTCLELNNGFPLLHLCTQSSISQSMPQSDARQQFTCFISKLFCCCICISKSTFGSKSDTTPLLLVYKKFWTTSYLSRNLASYILLQMHYIRLIHVHWSNNFANSLSRTSPWLVPTTSWA